MDRRNFYYCCGVSELGNFGWDADLNAHQLQALLLQARSENKGFCVCTTVASQKGAAKLLKGEKFRVLRTFKNPNTGARVTLWGRETEL